MAFNNTVLSGTATHNGRTYKEGDTFKTNVKRQDSNVESVEISKQSKITKIKKAK